MPRPLDKNGYTATRNVPKMPIIPAEPGWPLLVTVSVGSDRLYHASNPFSEGVDPSVNADGFIDPGQSKTFTGSTYVVSAGQSRFTIVPVYQNTSFGVMENSTVGNPALGTPIGRIPIYDSQGNVLGYTPVYKDL